MDTIGFFFGVAMKSTAILTAAASLTWMLRKSPAAVRYMIWSVALAAALAVPALSLLFDAWSVKLAAPVPIMSELTPGPAAAVPVLQAGSRNWPDWIGIVWGLGVLAALARIAVGHGRVRLMLRRAEPVDERNWLYLLTETADRLHLRRRVDLRRTMEADVPISYGFLRPCVVLDRATEAAGPERRRVVLTHELVHVRRHDSLVSLLAQSACAVYWFHPLAWWAVAQFRREQERSCDDAVVRSGIGETDYAGHLVAVARQLQGDGGARWAAGLSMARRWDIEERVGALLDRGRKRGPLNRRMLAGTVALAALCVIPFAALRGQEAGPSAAVAGSVLDASGATVPHATVLLKSADGNRQEIARTGEAGEYRFPHVRPGKYDVEVRAPGFSVLQKAGLSLNPSANEHLDLQLALGQVSESFDVVGKGLKPAPVPAGVPHRIRVGGNVQATKLVKVTRPVYPVNAQSAGTEGTVLLRAVISTSGDLLNLAAINTADADLVKAAVDAVQQWKYEPTLLNGMPVEVVTTIAVNFKLEP